MAHVRTEISQLAFLFEGQNDHHSAWLAFMW